MGLRAVGQIGESLWLDLNAQQSILKTITKSKTHQVVCSDGDEVTLFA